MPTLMPGARWEPLGPTPGQALMRAHDIICIHTMVGSLRGTDAYFEQKGWGGTESHFGTGHDGEIVQWQDTERVAEANLNGNWHIISIENADRGTGFPAWDVNNPAKIPAFTPQQVEANARIVAWACKKYNIPCVLIPDSKPGRRGIGYHRQGCDGNFSNGRVPGGELWSSAFGKVCPGDKRIAQIPQIIARANQLLKAPVTPTAPPTEEAELNAEETRMLREMHRELTLPLPLTGRPGAETDNMYGHNLNADAILRKVLARLDSIEAKLAQPK